MLIWENGRQIWSIELIGRNRRTHLAEDQSQISSIAAYSGLLYFANKTDGTIRQTRQLR